MSGSIEEHVHRHALESPDHAALVSATLALTYGELWCCGLRAADWMRAHGVGPGCRVALTASDDGWFAAAYLGTHLAGGVAIPLDLRQPEPVVRRLLDAADAHLVIDGPGLTELSRLLLDELAHRGSGPWPSWTPPGPSEVADILFTSGTTSQPKGVVLTHGAVTAAARNINQFIGNGATDREVITVPLHHSFGLGRLRCKLMARGTLILVPGLMFPGMVFEALESHAATGLSCVPAGMTLLLEAGGPALACAGRNLRYVELGSSSMDPGMKRRLMRALPCARLCMHYGLTEASRSAFIEFHADAGHIDSVGRATPGVQLQIRDDQRRPVGPGVIGDIHVRAATLMREYWRDPERTRQVLDAEGWLDTGDMGWLDGGGYLYLSGRRDDQINVGGLKLLPQEVEAAAAAEADVAECACVGGPDPDGILGEVPVLYVVPRDGEAPDEERLRRRLGRRLEAHAVPRIVRIVKELPRTTSGKLLRATLRRIEADQRR